jgi:hypothetical protein
MTMTSNDDDRLDRLLRRDARAVIDDEGFGARVMGALPPLSPARSAAQRPWLTPVLVLGSTALGSALAWLFAPDGVNAAQGMVDLLSLRGLTPAAIAMLGMTITLLIAAIVIAVDTD